MKQRWTIEHVKQWQSMQASGKSFVRIAKEIGISRVTMQRIMNREVDRLIKEGK